MMTAKKSAQLQENTHGGGCEGAGSEIIAANREILSIRGPAPLWACHHVQAAQRAGPASFDRALCTSTRHGALQYNAPARALAPLKVLAATATIQRASGPFLIGIGIVAMDDASSRRSRARAHAGGA